MIVRQIELAKAISKCQSIVPKKSAIPALEGALVRNGYLIASNGEITIQVKLEGSEGEEFIIPAKAFEVIKNLPDGDINISCDDKYVVTLKIDKIKNSYSSYEPSVFAFNALDESGMGFRLPGSDIMQAFSHVVFASAKKDANKVMTGVFLEGSEGHLNVAALDGHVVAWDKVDAFGIGEFELIIPVDAVKKILSMGIEDEIEIAYTQNSAVFRTEEYTIHTRLIDGKYFAFKKMFQMSDNSIIASRIQMIESITRAKMCADAAVPVVMELEGDELLLSLNHGTSQYSESIQMLSEIPKQIKIGFDSKLILESIKAFTCDKITMQFIGPKAPVTITADDSDLAVLVLPVMIRV